MSRPAESFPSIPVALTIAGSDNSAGAGIQADLKTFTALGVYGLTAVTCVVAEVPGRVLAVQPVEVAVIRDQVLSSLEAFPVRAIKTGMLYSRAIIELVADLYTALDAETRPPLVVDPVMVATSGDALLQADAVAVYRERLFPLAALVTPNLDEASVLLDGRPIKNETAMRAAGRELAARFGVPFLMKGGHLGGDIALDVLCLPDGRTQDHALPYVHGVSTHGTGCTYSAAVAGGLARGGDLPTAVAGAKAYMDLVLKNHYRLRDGTRDVTSLRHSSEYFPDDSNFV